MLPNRSIYCSLPAWDLRLLLRSNIDVYSISEDLNTNANYGWVSAGISCMEVKCRVKFLGLEANCQFNSIHGVNKSKSTQSGKFSNFSQVNLLQLPALHQTSIATTCILL